MVTVVITSYTIYNFNFKVIAAIFISLFNTKLLVFRIQSTVLSVRLVAIYRYCDPLILKK